MGRRTLPAHGESGFPTDGQIQVLISTAVPQTVVRRLGEEYRLRDADGALVPLEPIAGANRLFLKPQEGLRPNTRYRLERVFAYDRRGLLLSDTERVRQAYGFPPGYGSVARGEPIERRWYLDREFVTGRAPASVNFAPPDLVRVEMRDEFGLFDGVSFVWDYRVPKDLPDLLLALEVEGSPRIQIVLHTGRSRRSGWSYDPIFGYGVSRLDGPRAGVFGPRGWARVRLRLISRSGVLLPGGPWRRVTATASPWPGFIKRVGSSPMIWTHSDDGRAAIMGPREMTDRFFAPPLVTSPPAKRGPLGCTYGLDARPVSAQRVLSHIFVDRRPVGRLQQTLLGVERNTHKKTCSVLEWHDDAWRSRLRLKKCEAIKLLLASDSYVLARWRPSGWPNAGAWWLERHPARGRRTWRARAGDVPRDAQFAIFRGHVVFVWLDHMSQSMRWRVLDETSGKVLSRGRERLAPWNYSDAAFALTKDHDGFVLVWAGGRDKPLLTGRLDLLGLSGYRIIDTAPVWAVAATFDGDNLGFAYGLKDGQVRFRGLLGSGELSDKTTLGYGGWPKIASNLDVRQPAEKAYFLVSWGQNSVQMSVVDTQGHSTPPRRVTDAVPTLRGAEVSAIDGLYLSYVDENGDSVTKRLQCRTGPELRAPSWIDPVTVP